MSQTLDPLTIHEGADYVYIGEKPEGCAGHFYRAHRVVLHIPVYQKLVLVECLSGQDKGLWFVCSLANFSCRYKLAEGQNGDRI